MILTFWDLSLRINRKETTKSSKDEKSDLQPSCIQVAWWELSQAASNKDMEAINSKEKKIEEKNLKPLYVEYKIPF